MTGRAGAADPNVKGLVETSAAVVPLGVVPKLKPTGAAGAAVEVVGAPKVKPVVGFFSAVGVPKENGVVSGFDSAGAVLGGRPNENGVAGGGVPNRDLDASVLVGSMAGEGVDAGAVAAAGRPKAKTLFGASVVAAGAAGAGDGGGCGAPRVMEVVFDGTAFTGSAADGCSGDRLGVGAGTDSTSFAGTANVKGWPDGVAAGGFSPSFGTSSVEDLAAESEDVANANIGCDCEANGDGVISATFGTDDAGTSAGFGCSTVGVVKVTVVDLAKTEELAKRFGSPGGVGAALEAGATVTGKVGVTEATLIVSGVGGTSDIVGRAGAVIGETVIGAVFATSVGGANADAGLVKENGSEVIGGSFASVKSCVIVV